MKAEELDQTIKEIEDVLDKYEHGLWEGPLPALLAHYIHSYFERKRWTMEEIEQAQKAGEKLYHLLQE
jgi:hypothetical protein